LAPRPDQARRTARDLLRALREEARVWLYAGEDLILIAVAAILLAAGLLVVGQSIGGLIHVFEGDRNVAETVVGFAETALLALILAELVRSLLVTLEGAGLTPEPFLVIAIVAIPREILITVVQIPTATQVRELMTPVVAELLGLTVITLLLVAGLAVVRRTRTPHTEALEAREEARKEP